MKGRADEEVDIMADLLCSFKALNIPIDESTLDEFMNVDDKNNKEFSHEILDDVNEAHSPAPTGNDIPFCGFEHILVYNKVFEIEDQLLCPEVQV